MSDRQKQGGGALWEADPFYTAAEALQDEMDSLESSFLSWSGGHGDGEEVPLKANGDECARLLTACDSVRVQLAEFHKAVSALTENPQQFHISQEELMRRFQFVKDLSASEAQVRHAILTGNLDTEKQDRPKPLRALVGSPVSNVAREKPTMAQASTSSSDAPEARIHIAPPTSAPYAPSSLKGQTGLIRGIGQSVMKNRRCLLFSSCLAGLILWLSSAFSGA